MLLNRGEKTRNNFFRILRAVWLEPEISRVELAAQLSMDKATVSIIVGHMIDHNLIVVTQKSKDALKVGRKREGLILNLEYGYVIGLEIQHDRMVATAVDLSYHRICSHFYTIKTNRDNLDTNFFTVYNDFIGRRELKGKSPMGIGVGLTGIMNTAEQIILRSKPLGILKEDYDFHTRVIDKLDVPVFMGNDANCCASGILAKFRNRDYRHFLFLYFYYRPQGDRDVDDMRLGLGIGVVLNENLYTGLNGTAGEFRSVFWNDSGESQLDLSPREIQSIRDSEKVREKMFRELSRNMALLVTVMNFKTVFIGGDVDYLPANREEIFQQEVTRSWPYSKGPDCRLKVLPHEDDLVSYSGGGMFLQHLFSDPERTEDLELKKRWWEMILD